MRRLNENLRDTRIILGSKSPRRRFLLRELGLDFEVAGDNSDDNEFYPQSLSKTEIPVYLAEQKAVSLDKLLIKNTLLITADTIVWSNDRVIGKPTCRDNAINILSELSGTRHEVISGVCLKSLNKKVTFYSTTTVFFNNLTTDDIVYYVDKYRPYDKAGAYGIQEWIGYTGISAVSGSYFNVMGLPVDMLYQQLLLF